MSPTTRLDTSALPVNTAGSHAEEPDASLIIELMQLALAAPDIPGAVWPVLQAMVDRTAADGATYFEAGGALFRARASAGEMPENPVMDAVRAYGMPSDQPIVLAAGKATGPLFYNDTRSSNDTVGFPNMGVVSMAVLPVKRVNRELTGLFLLHALRPHAWTVEEEELFSAVTATVASLTARLVAEEKAIQAQEDTLRVVGLAAERQESDARAETDRVIDLAMRIARQMRLDDDLRNDIRWGIYLHDIGKIAVPDSILHKPGKLDEDEWDVMRRHVEHGHEFACRLGFVPAGALDLILCHHEKWAGGGYPNGLEGEEIPLPARIFAVCDVYDTLVSERPYKRAWSHDEALREIIAQSGSQFDPAVVDAFVDVMSQDERS